MIYSPSTTAALGIVEDAQPEEPLTLRGEGLWVCLVSSGKCVVSLSDLELMPAGSALLLPPQNAAAGHLVLSRGPLTLAPENECHLLCVQLTGQAAEQFLAGLSEMPFLARGPPLHAQSYFSLKTQGIFRCIHFEAAPFQALYAFLLCVHLSYFRNFSPDNPLMPLPFHVSIDG